MQAYRVRAHQMRAFFKETLLQDHTSNLSLVSHLRACLNVLRRCIFQLLRTLRWVPSACKPLCLRTRRFATWIRWSKRPRGHNWDESGDGSVGREAGYNGIKETEKNFFLISQGRPVSWNKLLRNYSQCPQRQPSVKDSSDCGSWTFPLKFVRSFSEKSVCNSNFHSIGSKIGEKQVEGEPNLYRWKIVLNFTRVYF